MQYKQHNPGVKVMMVPTTGLVIAKYQVIRNFDGKTIETGTIEKYHDNPVPAALRADEIAIKGMLRTRYPKPFYEVWAKAYTDN